MSSFQIELQALPGAEGDLCALTVHASQSVLTRLLRQGANHEDEAAQVPIAPLAFWVADHWWRLRCECRPLEDFTPKWRQAHELSGIGNGYAWPRTTIWGEGERVVIVSKADPPGTAGPVRYLENFVGFVPAQSYEDAMDGLLDAAVGAVAGEDQAALSTLVEALREERADPEAATWRRLEAINGYNPDEASEQFIEGLLDLAKRFSLLDVEEAAAAYPGDEAAAPLGALLSRKIEGIGVPLSFRRAVEAGRNGLHPSRLEPWQMAEAAAAEVRRTLGAGKRPLRNKTLGELAGVDPRQLQASSTHPSLPYGLRLATERDGDRILLRAQRGTARRFELMRALGDAIWTNNSPLGPVARSGTARQKFQRAFAASLLCPPDALHDYLGTDEPTTEDVAEAARHFHVADAVVRTILVNKRMVDRIRLPLRFDERDTLESLADAA